MRRYALLLLLLAVVAGCGSASGAPAAGATILTAASGAAAADQSSTPAATPAPTPRPTVEATQRPSPAPVSRQAWTAAPTALLKTPGDTDDLDAHVGANFPVTLTGDRRTVGGASWERVEWSTPGRRATSWVAARLLTGVKPAAETSADVDALDPALAAYLAGLGSHVGVEVYDLTRRVTYGYRETAGFIVASSVKVPIMCAFLAKLEAAGREPTKNELYLLRTMIENSNNNSATQLYRAIGDAAGLSAYMKKIGVTGLKASRGTWGWSTNTAAGMVALLTLLEEGRILSPAHRALAFDFMRNVEKDQQVGVQDTAPAGASVAMKVGWVNQPNGLWAMSSHGIVTYRGETWVISVFTGDGSTLKQGFDRARHICDAVADALTGTN